jgi:hypothetical protein
MCALAPCSVSDDGCLWEDAVSTVWQRTVCIGFLPFFVDACAIYFWEMIGVCESFRYRLFEIIGLKTYRFVFEFSSLVLMCACHVFCEKMSDFRRNAESTVWGVCRGTVSLVMDFCSFALMCTWKFLCQMTGVCERMRNLLCELFGVTTYSMLF